MNKDKQSRPFVRKSPQIAVLHSLFAGSRKLERWRTNKQK